MLCCSTSQQARDKMLFPSVQQTVHESQGFVATLKVLWVQTKSYQTQQYKWYHEEMKMLSVCKISVDISG